MMKDTDRIIYECGFGPGDGDSHVERVEPATRPTADLGDDGELVADLEFLFPNTDGVFGDREVIYGEVARKAHDRLILYREALEVLLLVKDAVDYRGDACHPAEMVGAVLDKCILERIDAVLSRSGG